MMDPYLIVLADDHMMFRQGVRRILEEISAFRVTGEVKDGLELLRLLQAAPPHLVILDISMPNLRGIEATREIKRSHPDMKVLILTMHKDKEYLYHALGAGADGYILKEDADDELVAAIESIRKGNVYISSLLSSQVSQLIVQSSRSTSPTAEDLSKTEPLSNREREVLKLIAEAKSNKEIADLLCISIRTVQHHRSNIMKKLDIKKSTDLVKYAIRKGYVSISL
ncbi:response regulator transcription factor [Desulforhabdus sp. TSK]|uniref:response regulator n=1 Tax=Desulforhabdus sp. TSK TaxID=2925014 RepID=UPI001FC8B743|nr:response regulator transcription factor [Desulforhabdus sp. TSK]